LIVIRIHRGITSTTTLAIDTGTTDDKATATGHTGTTDKGATRQLPNPQERQILALRATDAIGAVSDRYWHLRARYWNQE